MSSSDDGGGAGHAAFAGAAEGGLDDAARGILGIGIGHDDDVIFRAAIGLHALAVLGAHFVDVTRDGRGADKGNRLHLRMGEQGVHDFASAVNDIQDTLGQAGLLQQLHDFNGSERNFLAGLEDEGIATGDGNGIHPQGHHGGEIKRRDAHAHAERLADGLAIDAARDILQHLAHQERGGAEGEFHDLHAAFHVAARFHERLAVLASVAGDDFLEMFFQEHFEFGEHADAFDGWGVTPRGKGAVRGGDGGVHIGHGADGAFRDDFAGGGVVDGGGGAGGGEPFAGDVVGAGEHII